MMIDSPYVNIVSLHPHGVMQIWHRAASRSSQSRCYILAAAAQNQDVEYVLIVLSASLSVCVLLLFSSLCCASIKLRYPIAQHLLHMTQAVLTSCTADSTQLHAMLFAGVDG